MIINPIQYYREMSEQELYKILNNYTNKDLYKIIKKYMPDNTRNIYRRKNKEDIIKYIIFRSKMLADKGSVFS